MPTFSVTIFSDLDQDRIADVNDSNIDDMQNNWEQTHQFNPLNNTDPNKDKYVDGLTNLANNATERFTTGTTSVKWFVRDLTKKLTVYNYYRSIKVNSILSEIQSNKLTLL